MNKEKQISGLCQLSSYLLNFLEKNPEIYNEDDEKISSLLRKSEIENSWFTLENQKFSLSLGKVTHVQTPEVYFLYQNDFLYSVQKFLCNLSESSE